MASESTDAFRSKLNQKWKQKALDELNEIDKERDGAVQALREWSLQQPWLKTPTDTEFLIRFLRVRKYSQLAARSTLEQYWTARTKYKDWYNPEVSPDNPIILDIIKSGFYLFTPGEDSQGRRLIIERPGALRVEEIIKKYGTVDVIFQAVMCIWDVLNMDERIQVNGFLLLHDGTMSDTDTAKSYNISTMKRCMHIYQKAYPTRIKGLHVYGLPLMFETLLRFVKSLFSDKIANRLHIHGKSLVSVYKYIDQSALPKEYLPDNYDGKSAGSINDVVDNMVQTFKQPDVVEHIRDLNSGKYGVDIEMKAKFDVPTESYRKLNID
ncbi:alpha-tocopherol transfer protein-like [Ruditapes philippinarum]|uniref:alpha-tocopherol transfer protein-like n=1 Tax=Ruditapes philippinarum TaxID=129788 RepID=UPI00295B75E0|nr:alpha-tocopherol transfer protein-like [Ruditapes philippinarum]